MTKGLVIDTKDASMNEIQSSIVNHIIEMVIDGDFNIAQVIGYFDLMRVSDDVWMDLIRELIQGVADG